MISKGYNCFILIFVNKYSVDTLQKKRGPINSTYRAQKAIKFLFTSKVYIFLAFKVKLELVYQHSFALFFSG